MDRITIDSDYFNKLYHHVNSDGYNQINELSSNISSIGGVALTLDHLLTDQIRHTLSTDGYIVLPIGDAYEFNDLREWLVPIVGPLMRENTKDKKEFAIIESEKDGKYFANSSYAQPIHTDEGHTISYPRYVVLYCKSQSIIGGYSTLVPLQKLYETLVSQFGDMVALLFDKNAITVTNVYGIETKNILLQLPDKKIGITYSPVIRQLICKENVFQMYHFITEYVHDIKNQIRFKLNKGDLLLFDNCRVLHGRTRFSENHKRTLYRLWFSEIKINS